MRLKSIKLAGFKSFVDPTTVSLPSNLCAVVGPNGCGKSNIIDAVRWVMGESSAKNLRGEQMTDVIFNGSTNRKPVGQASVELIFDNSDHTITGEYAAYNEISIKRQVTSDAQSTYFLNGTRCRRRDITDIFLGTGLGPRSYSIIEQGMVSRLIESKPEELRVFIEEAAGISRYKERRKETESRIRRTKENLERLTDIRDELERQLQHLQRQAAAAEKYREYKKEERDRTAQLNSLRWSTLNDAVSSGEKTIAELEVAVEASIAEQRRFDAGIEQLRSENVDAAETHQKVQQEFYSLGNDISRIEQSINYQQQQRQQLEEELRLTRQSLEQARRELAEDLDRIESLGAELAGVEPALEAARAGEEQSNAAQERAEADMIDWQGKWDEFNKASADATRRAEVAQQRINHLDSLVERGQTRKLKLEQEQLSLESAPEEDEISGLDKKLAELAEEQARLNAGSSELGSSIEQSRQQIKDQQESVNRERSTLQTLLGKQSSLEALQQAALREGGDAAGWLEEHNISHHSRLVDTLRVEDGWQKAVETVLGKHLQAYCIDDLSVLGSTDSFNDGDLSLIDQTPAASQPESVSHGHRRLADTLVAGHGAINLLQGIYCADDLQQAHSVREHLQAGESVVTRAGEWLGSNWLKVARGFDATAGMIERTAELETLEQQIKACRDSLAQAESALESSQQALRQYEQQRETMQQQMNEHNRVLSDVKADRSARVMKIEQVRERSRRLAQELGELVRQLEVERENIGSSRQELQKALDQMETDTETRESLLKQRDELRSALDSARQKARHDREQTHQLALRHQTLSAQHQSMLSARDRVAAQVDNLAARETQFSSRLGEAEDPVPALRQELETKLSERVEIEASLNSAKALVDDIEHSLREHENNRQQAQDQTQQLRDRLTEQRLAIEGATVKRAALIQALEESNYDLNTVLAGLAEEDTVSSCESDLERIGNRIQRLGAINLAAIDEYTTQSERKHYLDAQNEDLEKALGTLENAIRKIDRETRTRFKETFDKVNAGLQDLFPRVFGGGHAYLDMIGEDLLDTGVAIMARPPGKKNSTIHLLSGGEKAMTAIALVFSIFRLNPSPFCMLDEVDAPLDDANVGRYANLVKEMSAKVQFIFITHNRITMEHAHQLLGVTMHEPGVSRMVAVDVDEAAELAAM